MHRLTRHLRGLLVALAALALSAGVVLAAHPTAGQRSTDKIVVGSETSGQTLTVTTDDEDEDADEEEDTDADEDADEDAEVDEDADEGVEAPEVDESTGSEPSAERKQNHGWFVSQAAQGAAPASATSHGAYVSGIAKSDAGKPAAATAAKTKAKGPKTGSH